MAHKVLTKSDGKKQQRELTLFLDLGMQVSACQSYGHDIVSELLKVEVYQPLSIQPKGLVLTPGSHYVVRF